MEGSNPTAYFFVKEIFLNIIIALRRLFLYFCFILNVFTKCSNFLCVFVFFVVVVVVFCLILFRVFFIFHI